MDVDDTLARARDLAEQLSGMEGSEPHYPALALELAQTFQALDDHMISGRTSPPEEWR
jgi:hypothetical protein